MPLSPAKHRKILRPLRGDAAPKLPSFRETKLSEMKTKQSQSNSKRAPLENFPAFLAASRPDARAEHDPL